MCWCGPWKSVQNQCVAPASSVNLGCCICHDGKRNLRHPEEGKKLRESSERRAFSSREAHVQKRFLTKTGRWALNKLSFKLLSTLNDGSYETRVSNYVSQASLGVLLAQIEQSLGCRQQMDNRSVVSPNSILEVMGISEP